ncbi:MAG: response regulator [Alphaproteobacteria bacterium]|nr:MAG: response regulator [Alphaproteobacteria bacterium]
MCHVLIIEDEPLIAMDIEYLLAREGATSFAFANSEQDAVDLAFERRPDLITSDVSLLEGTGPAAVATILTRLGPIPVLFITATPDACIPCAPPGEVLRKPLNPSAIKQAYQELSSPGAFTASRAH